MTTRVSLAPLVALVVAGLGIAYAFGRETPVGRVEGRVVLADTRKPLGDVFVLLSPVDEKNRSDDQRERRTVRTRDDGRFTVGRLPAGKYLASAYTKAHKIDEAVVRAAEGETTLLSLALKRSEPDLQIAQHQHVFATREKAFLPVRGYVDAQKPGGKDTVRVRVFQTRLSEVLRSPNAADALERIGRAYDEKPARLPRVLLRPDAGARPRLLWQRDLPLVEADREGFFNKRVPLNTKGPGLFLVDVSHANKAVSSWVLATDTALIVKRVNRQQLAYAVDMKTGAPIAGAAVRTYRDGNVVASGATNARGLVEYNVPAAGGSSGAAAPRLVTVALRGSDEAVLGRVDYEQEEQGRYAVATYTDRPIYRPGQSVFYKGIARRKNNQPGNYSVARNETISVEILDPDGNRIVRETKTTNARGSFAGSVALSPEAPTGTFSVVSTVSGERHTTDLVVASYRKPEFAVTVTPARTRYVRGDEMEMTLDAQYYFGAPVAGGRVRYYVFQDTDWSAEYPDDWDFDEGEEVGPPGGDGGGGGYYGQTILEGEASLDENGKATIRFRPQIPSDVDPSELPQEQIFTLSATVSDASNREVEGAGIVRASAGDFRLSVRPEGYVAAPGRASSIVVQARDFARKPLANIPVTLRAEYSLWNPKTKTSERKTVSTQTTTTGPDGGAVVNVSPPRAGELLVIAEAKDAGGRTIRGRAYLWATGDEGGDLDTEYADLSLLTDKRRYLPGETARVLVNTARTGQTVLLSVESDRIYQTISVPITKRSTVVRVPVLAAYGPNVSLAACYVRDKKFAGSETPLRVTLPERDLSVSITTDRARYAPGDPITYQLEARDARGRPAPDCELSLGVVDESIYALREDDPRLLRDAFFPRRYNRVSTNYSFAVEYLGDADKAEPRIEARKRFPDTAFWDPFLVTDESGRASARFTLPDNLTTWRATVLACSASTALGRETSKIVVAKDFFVRLETPRFLTQKDQSELVALVHNDSGKPQTAFVRLQAQGLRTDGGTRTLELEPGGVGRAVWPATASDIGEANLRVTAWTKGATTGAGYTDGVELRLPVRAHGRDTFDSRAGTLEGPDTQTETIRLDNAAVVDATRLVVRVTPSVSGAIAPALDYLVGFPYGCAEQTLSRFLPNLYAQRLLMNNPTLLDEKKTAALPAMVRDGLSRLYKMQHRETGGWGWWEQDNDDPFITAYVLYGLSVARAQGYPVSQSVLEKGREGGAKLLAKTPAADKPFLLYALALAGDTASARKYAADLPLDKIAPDGLAYLVLLDVLLGNTGPVPGGAALASLNRRAVFEGDNAAYVHWRNPSNRWDGSDRLATALVLRALLAADPTSDLIAPALRWLMRSRTDAYWGNTRDTSFVLAALCDYLAARPSETGPPAGSIVVSLNNKPLETIDTATAAEPEIVLRVPPTRLQKGENTIALAQSGGGMGTVFYAVSLRQTVASDTLNAVPGDGLSITRVYQRVLPRRVGLDSWRLDAETSADNRFAPGDRLRVRLVVRSKRALSYVLIEDAFPAGLEVTERGTADEVVEWGYWYSSVDVRDDRVAFFARTLPAGTHVIEYNLRAQTPGAFGALPALIQAMYAPEIRAETAEAAVTVR